MINRMICYKRFIFLHAVMVESPMAVIEAFLRGFVLLFAAFIMTLSILISLTCLNGHWFVHSVITARKMLRESLLTFVTGMSLLFFPCGSCFVYWNYKAEGSWEVGPIPTLLGWMDPRRLSTFSLGQGRDAKNIHPDAEHKCMDSAVQYDGKKMAYTPRKVLNAIINMGDVILDDYEDDEYGDDDNERDVEQGSVSIGGNNDSVGFTELQIQPKQCDKILTHTVSTSNGGSKNESTLSIQSAMEDEKKVDNNQGGVENNLGGVPNEESRHGEEEEEEEEEEESLNLQSLGSGGSDSDSMDMQSIYSSSVNSIDKIASSFTPQRHISEEEKQRESEKTKHFQKLGKSFTRTSGKNLLAGGRGPGARNLTPRTPSTRPTSSPPASI